MPALVKAAPAAAGPQCYNCRKRRVRCDSSLPKCGRCKLEKLDCLGYAALTYDVPFRVAPQKKHDYSLVVSQDRAASIQERVPDLPLINGIMQTLAPFDREYFAMLESCRAFNGVVLPRAYPPQKPFKRPAIKGDMVTLCWLVWPKVLQYLFIVDLRFMESSYVTSADPLSRHEVCRYRGLGLTELRKLLPEAVSDPHCVALCGIIILMAAELQLCSQGTWTKHHAAAQRIMWLRGGCKSSMLSLPACHTIFVTYMVVDTVSASTTRSKDMSLALLEAQREYLDLMPVLKDDIMEFGTLCPVTILRSIAGVNIIRAQRHLSKTSHKAYISSISLTTSPTFEELQSGISSFDAGIWAEDVLNYGQPLPIEADHVSSDSDVKALTSLGLCYKAAAMVYLHISCRSFRGRGLHTTLDASRELLSRQAHYLFDHADKDIDAPLLGQLWKYIGWPLVVLAHVAVLAPRTVTAATSDEIALLRDVATKLESKKLHEAVHAVTEIWRNRQADSERHWSWDDAFPTKRMYSA